MKPGFFALSYFFHFGRNMNIRNILPFIFISSFTLLLGRQHHNLDDTWQLNEASLIGAQEGVVGTGATQSLFKGATAAQLQPVVTRREFQEKSEI